MIQIERKDPHDEKIPVLIIFVSIIVSLCACGLNTQKASEDSKEGPVNLIWWTYMSTTAPKALEEVLEKANEISAEKIGVTVDMQFKNEDQFTLDHNTGDYYDMTFSCDWCNNFDDNARRGYYYDLTELVKSETPALYDADGYPQST